MNVCAMSSRRVCQLDSCLIRIGKAAGGKKNTEFAVSEPAGWNELRQLIAGEDLKGFARLSSQLQVASDRLCVERIGDA